MKLRSSVKILIGFVCVSAGAYYGYKFITDRIVLGRDYPEIKPGTVTLLGVDPGSGFRIIVANQAAALVQGGHSDLDVGEIERADEGQSKKKIPLRQMMAILSGDEKELGRFVMSLNNVKEGGPDWPTNAPLWKGEDLQKALDGDKVLLSKLETDLNVKLDGTPQSTVRISSMLNGILVDLPVPVKVMVAGQQKTLIGRYLEPYRPSFSRAVEDHIKEKQSTNEMIRGYYIEELKKLSTGDTQKEDIRGVLVNRLDSKRLRKFAEDPEFVLSKARIILNDSFFTGARYSASEASNDTKLYRITVSLTNDGRYRIWRYSKLHRGTQLLFVVNGTAIAAPWVEHELPQSEITITSLQDESMVKEAVDTINQIAKGNSK